MSRIQSPTHRVKRRKRAIRVSIGAVVLVFVLIGLSVYAARTDRFVIGDIYVAGAGFSDPQQIQAVAQQDISGDHLFVYPKANEFLYSKSQIERDILADFPAVESVTVSVQKEASSSRPSLDIQVKERVPFALWCGNVIDAAAGTSTPSSQDASPCYFADLNGYIFSGAPHFSGDLYPVFYGGLAEATTSASTTDSASDGASDVSDTSNIIGNSILNPPELGTIMDFAKSIGPTGFKVFAYQITEDPSGDLCDFYYGSTTSSYLRTDCTGDFSDMSANLQSFITDPHFSTSTPMGYQYIDLRFGDKIVYKRK